jgi:hypothetical protein
MTTPLIDNIKIFHYKRELAKTVGNIRHFSKLIGIWEQNCNAINEGKHVLGGNSKKLEGNIKFYRERISKWKENYDEIKAKLEELGVKVELAP